MKTFFKLENVTLFFKIGTVVSNINETPFSYNKANQFL